jgi:transposase
MEYGGLKISERVLSRHHLLRMVVDGRLSLGEAAVGMGVSYRHAKRLKGVYLEDGVKGLVHGNQGRSPENKVEEDLRSRVLALSRKLYGSFNDTHFTEMLAKREGIILSRETVRKLRREDGIKPKCKRRARKHHKRRPRKVCEGLMILWDGSPHRWFGREATACCCMSAIDDATGKIVGLFFVEAECSWAYLELARRVIADYGVPACVYQDCHSSLKRNDDFWSIEEQLAGRQEPTQVGKALDALRIEPAFAKTPQAKGRVERLFKTLQDRLCAMLELEGIKDIAGANEYAQTFVSEFNEKYAVLAQDSQKAWRQVDSHLDLTRVLSLKYEATIANDNAIRFGGLVIDVPPGPAKRSYAQARAELRQLLDGSWRVYYQDKLIATAPASEIVEPIRTKSRRKGVRAAVDSKWVYMASKPTGRTDPGNSIRRAGPGRQIGGTRIA